MPVMAHLAQCAPEHRIVGIVTVSDKLAASARMMVSYCRLPTAQHTHMICGLQHGGAEAALMSHIVAALNRCSALPVRVGGML